MSQEFILSGRLARDPDIRSTLAGSPVANLRVLQTRGYRKGEDWVEEVEGFDLVTFNEKLITRVIQPFFSKGKRLRIRGRLQTRSWEDQNKVTRYSTEVVIDDLRLLERPAQMTRSSTDTQAA
ncbi:MAG: single-stranded DNA-binding protein [Henriciella sp.]|nr:single-stranded DNA-binding protein [Henriciella sp.]MBO6696113.1 single-stranded DNA-binding protein [Henriciella sp.]